MRGDLQTNINVGALLEDQALQMQIPELEDTLGASRADDRHPLIRDVIAHDLIREVSMRLDRLGRYDQYLARAADRPRVRGFWEQVRHQEERDIVRLAKLVAREVKDGVQRLEMIASE